MPGAWQKGSGFSNLLSGYQEQADTKEILERWRERCTKKVPGTHTLGKEYKTTDARPR